MISPNPKLTEIARESIKELYLEWLEIRNAQADNLLQSEISLFKVPRKSKRLLEIMRKN